MKYTLKSFSQDIHLNRPDESQHFLVFDREDGTEFRIPVPQETIIAITQSTLAYEAKRGPKEKVLDEEVEDEINELEEREEQDRAEAEDEAEAFFSEDDDLGDADVFPPGGDLEDVEPEPPAPKALKPVMKAHKQRTSAESEDEVPSL